MAQCQLVLKGLDGGWGGIRVRSSLVSQFVDPSGKTDTRAMFYTDGQKLEIDEIRTYNNEYAYSKFKNVTSTGAVGSDLTHPDTDNPKFRLGDAYLSAKLDVMLVGEVWAKADIVAPYFKTLNINFNIDLAHGILKAVSEGIDDDLIKKLIANYEIFKKSNPNFIDATIIDYQGQNRIASILSGEIAKTKAATNLLLNLPENLIFIM